MKTRTATVKIATLIALAAIITATPAKVSAQYSISEVITDFKGYWKSGAGNINSVKPDNSHNVVAFTYNGVRYSTGVNDALLTSTGDNFIPGQYKSLPVSSITGTATGDTKIGLGQMFDGVDNGASNPAPQNSLVKYITDGERGLDLGTCVANLPTGDVFFSISNIQPHSIGDNVPDLVITQVADPSSTMDSYEFVDINGTRVGNKVDINLGNLSVVGNWTADFYSITNPMTLQAGFTKTDRPIRLWTTDFSTFGINSGNINRIAYFKIHLSGQSDVAFVAYNEKAFTVANSTLPITLGYLKAQAVDQKVELKWQSQLEINSDRFVIEGSTDGIRFTAVDSVNAKGIAPSVYAYTDKQPATGKSWYRLKLVDKNGSFTYSQIVAVNISATATTISVFPNPTTNTLFVKQDNNNAGRLYHVRNMHGAVLVQHTATAASHQAIQVSHLPKGVYTLSWMEGTTLKAETFVKN